jgi:hypothetical protein
VDRPEQGRIVDVELYRSGKSIGRHPAVIVTSTANNLAGKPIAIVGISSKLHLAPKEDQVALAWFRGGHSISGLSKKCAAMCDLFQTTTEAAILLYRGWVTKKNLEQIRNRLVQRANQGKMIDHNPSTQS